MKLKSPFWQASLITFGMMIAGYVGMMLCNGSKDTPSMFLGVFFVFLMVVGAFAFFASLLWWILAAVVSSIRSRHAKS
jgi:hypothetical protein